MNTRSKFHQEFLKLKKQYPNDMVFIRVGDFYETFDADAVTLHREVGMALTVRRNHDGTSVSLAGVPHLNIEPLLTKLIAKKHRVVVCNRMPMTLSLESPAIHGPTKPIPVTKENNGAH